VIGPGDGAKPREVLTGGYRADHSPDEEETNNA
jgi:hypothetical protein